ncbi:MAG: nitroreductase family protein [Alphaproteobacteria bacterium]|nr:nitroreductase family protein [Alphaproteobacteria bacterium]
MSKDEGPFKRSSVSLNDSKSLHKRYGTSTPPPGAWNETLDLLLAHCSVRHYREGPLPDGALEAAIAAAQSASTSSNLQLWSVIAITEESRKQRLAVHAGGQAHMANAPLLLVWLADIHRLRRLGEAQSAATEGLDYFEAFLLAAVDAALAAQNAMTAFESLGLGGCYIGGMRNKPAEVAAELALPSEVFALFGMTVGVPDPARREAVKPRLPQEVVLMREQYAWSDQERTAIATYNERLRAFQREQAMKEQDWTVQATRRVADAKALTGRHILRDFLNSIGFKLR